MLVFGRQQSFNVTVQVRGAAKRMDRIASRMVKGGKQTCILLIRDKRGPCGRKGAGYGVLHDRPVGSRAFRFSQIATSWIISCAGAVPAPHPQHTDKRPKNATRSTRTRSQLRCRPPTLLPPRDCATRAFRHEHDIIAEGLDKEG